MPRPPVPRCLTALALVLACGAALAQSPEAERLDDFFAPGPTAPLALDLGAPPDEAPEPEPEPEPGEGDHFAADPERPAPALAAPPEPAPPPPAVAAPVVPEGWQTHAHFGVTFALPPAFALMEVTDDPRRGRSAAFQRQDPATGGGAVAVVAFMPPAERDDMLASMARDTGVEFRTAPQPVPLGPWALTDRSGTIDIPPGEGAPPGPAALRILSGDVATAWGQVPVVAIFAFNTDPSAAEALGAGLVGSLAVVDDPALIGAPEPETFLDGLIRYRLPPGARDSNVDEETRWISFREGGGQDHARIVLDRQPARDWLGDTILQEFAGPVDMREGEFAGQPVWIVHGRPTFTLAAARSAPGDAWRRTSYVMRTCAPDRGPAVLSAITTADRIAAGLTPEAMLAGFELIPTPDLAACPAPIMASFAAAAADPAMVFDPSAPPPTPLVLAPRSQFGLTLDLPEDFLTEDLDTDPEGGIGVAFRAPGLVATSFGGAGLRGSMVTLRFEPAATRDADRARTATEMGTPPVRQPDPVALLGAAFQDWRGAGTVMAGVGLAYRLLTHDEPGPNGWVPVIGFVHINEPAETAAAFERAVLASLRPAVAGQPWGVTGSGAQVPPLVAPVAEPPPVIPPAPPPVVAKPPVGAPPPDPTPDPDAAAWAQAQAVGDAGAVLGYLQDWPQGAHAEAARAWLAQRAIAVPDPAGSPDDGADWQRALGEGTPGAVLAYLERWPDGAHAPEAREWLLRRAIQPPGLPAPAPEPAPPPRLTKAGAG
jgi:hypothetical protein